MWWTESLGRIELRMTLKQARSVSHQGPCDADVAALRKVPAISRQLNALNADIVRACLREYGAWDSKELSDHDANLTRLLWCAGCDIAEEHAGVQS